jgi:hypothetical protein
VAVEATRIPEEVTRAQAFDVLDNLATPSTRWQIVFEPVAKRITLRVSGHDGDLTLDLAALDFDCRDTPQSVNLRGARPDFSTSHFIPIDQVDLSETMSEVLLSMKSTATLGRPEVTQQLSAGLLASSVCKF